MSKKLKAIVNGMRAIEQNARVGKVLGRALHQDIQDLATQLNIEVPDTSNLHQAMESLVDAATALHNDLTERAANHAIDVPGDDDPEIILLGGGGSKP